LTVLISSPVNPSKTVKYSGPERIKPLALTNNLRAIQNLL